MARSPRGLAVLAACLLVVASLAAPVGAGDNPSVYSFDPFDAEATPGEELEIDVVLSSQGDHADNPIVNLSATVGYDEDVLSITDVETGTWLAGEDAEDAGQDDDIETSVETEPGSVTIEQERVPDDGGVVGTAVVATLTVVVAEDAEPGEATLEFTDTAAHPVQFLYAPSATIDISEAESSVLDDAVPGFGPAAALAALLSLAVVTRTVASRR